MIHFLVDILDNYIFETEEEVLRVIDEIFCESAEDIKKALLNSLEGHMNNFRYERENPSI